MKINRLNIDINKDGCISAVGWDCGHDIVLKKYESPITAELSPDGEWVLIIEPIVIKDKPNEAVIFNVDGTVKAKLRSPFDEKGLLSFFVGTYIDGGVIKVRIVGYQSSTRISIESEFDLSLNDLKLVNERPCR